VITIKIKITRGDITWNYLNYFVNFGLNIAILPLLYRMLGPSEIGFWYVLLAIGGLSEIMDMGFSTIISRNVSYVVSGGTKIQTKSFDRKDVSDKVDYRLLSNLISASSKIYKYLGLVLFLVLSSLGTLYVYTVSVEELTKTTVLTSWGIFLFAVIFRIRFSFWNYVLRGVGAVKENNKAVVYSKILQFSFLLGLVSMGYGIVGASIAYLLGMISQRLLCAWYFMRYDDYGDKLKEFKNDTNKNEVVKDIVKSLRMNVFKQGQITLSFYLINKSMVILGSIFFNLSVAGMIGFTQQLLSLVSSFGNSLFNAYLPQFTSERLNKESKTLYKKLTMSLGTSFLIISLSGLFLALFGNYIFDFLKMNSQVLPYNQMLAFVFMYVMINNHFLCGTFITASNNLVIYKAYSISAGLMITCQILLSVLLPSIGVWALILPAILVQSAYNNWKWPFVVAQEFDTSISKMIKDSVITTFKVPYLIAKKREGVKL
jgi:O-antigen/teichoic acid export membrane protein